MKNLALFLILVSTVAFGGSLSDAKYYLVLFAADDGQSTPDTTHTWGAFFKITEQTAEWHSISWLPRNDIVSPLELGPQRGVNKNFDKTLADYARQERLLREFGPYEITAELYDLLEKRRQDLEANYWYRVLDTPNRMGKALDPKHHPEPFAVTCMHAITDAVLPVDPKGWLVTGMFSGIPGTAMVAWHLSDWYVRLPSDPHQFAEVPAEVDAKISETLKLGDYPQMQKLPLTPQNNHYCRTLPECRGALGLFGN